MSCFSKFRTFLSRPPYYPTHQFPNPKRNIFTRQDASYRSFLTGIQIPNHLNNFCVADNWEDIDLAKQLNCAYADLPHLISLCSPKDPLSDRVTVYTDLSAYPRYIVLTGSSPFFKTLQALCSNTADFYVNCPFPIFPFDCDSKSVKHSKALYARALLTNPWDFSSTDSFDNYNFLVAFFDHLASHYNSDLNLSNYDYYAQFLSTPGFPSFRATREKLRLKINAIWPQTDDDNIFNSSPTWDNEPSSYISPEIADPLQSCVAGDLSSYDGDLHPEVLSILTKLQSPEYTAQGFNIFNTNINVKDIEVPAITAFLQHLTSKVDSISNTFSSSVEKTDVARFLISLISKLALAYRCRADTVSLLLILTDFLATRDISTTVMAAYTAIIAPILTSLRGLVAQSMSAFVPFILPIVTIVVSTIGVFITTQLPDQKTLDYVLQRVSALGRSLQGGKTIYEFFSSLFTKVCDFYQEYVSGIPSDLSSIAPLVSGLDAWLLQVREIIDMETVDHIQNDPALCKKIMDLYRRGLVHSIALTRVKASPTEMTAFRAHMTILLPLFNKASQGCRASKRRMEPVVVFLHGKSGVGKTGVMTLLSQDLINDRFPGIFKEEPEATRTHTYYRNIEQEFWDGYTGQLIANYDDFGQKTDSLSDANLEFMELIRSANVADYPLHMAELVDKGRTFFLSEIVILSANQDKYDIKSLTHPDAFERRIDFRLEVDIVAKWKTLAGYLDVVKVKQLLGPGHQTSVYLFNISTRSIGTDSRVAWNPNMDNKGQKVWIDYEDLLQLLIPAYRQKRVSCEEAFEASCDRAKTLQPFLLRSVQPSTLPLPTLPTPAPPLLPTPPAPANRPNYKTQADTPSPPKDDYYIQSYVTHFSDLFSALYGRVTLVEESIASDDSAETLKNVYRIRQPSAEDLERSLFTLLLDECGLSLEQSEMQSLITDYQDAVSEAYDYAGEERETVLNRAKDDLILAISLLPFDVMDTMDLSCHDYNQRKQFIIECSPVIVESKHRDRLAKFAHTLKKSLQNRIANPLPSKWAFPMKMLKTVGILFASAATLSILTKFFTNNTACTFKRFIEKNPVLTEDHCKIAANQLCKSECKICATVIINKQPTIAGLQALASRYTSEALMQSGDYATRYRAGKIKNLHKPSSSHHSYSRTSNRYESEALFPNFCLLQSGLLDYDQPLNDKNIYKWPNVMCKFNCDVCIRILDTLAKQHLLSHVYGDFEADCLFIDAFRKCIKTALSDGTDYKAEGQIDVNCDELVENKISRNLYRVEWAPGGAINCLAIKGRCVLIPFHAISHLQQAQTFTLSNIYTDKAYTFNFQDCATSRIIDIQGKPKDSTILALPNPFPNQKELLSHFSNYKDLDKYNRINATLPCIRKVAGHPMVYAHVIRNASRFTVCNNDYDYVDQPCSLTHGYTYTASTMAGDCGTPLIACNRSLPKKILAVHVAGSPTGDALATVITHNELVSAVSFIPYAAQCSFTIPEEIDQDVDVVTPPGHFIPLGKLPKPCSTSGKTSIRPSPICEAVTPITTVPSVIKPIKIDGIVVDPLSRGLAKSGETPITPFPSNYLELAVADYQSVFLTNINPEYQRVFTLAEAITGIEGDTNLPPVNRKSSAGYPWANHTGGKPGKTKWLGEDEYIVDNPEVVAAVDKRLKAAMNGDRLMTPWIDCLKDERRDIEKCNAAKTRCFTCGPMDYILLFRQYFMGAIAHMSANKFTNESAIGTNVYSMDWTKIADRLRSKGPHCVAIDFSNYDGNLHPEVLFAVLKIYNSFYGDPKDPKIALDNMIRTVLWMEVVYSVHIFRDVLYQLTHSQTSGNPGTANTNTVSHSLYLRMAYLILTEGTDFHDITLFRYLIAAMLYGDDGAYNIHNNLIHLFNQSTLPHAFKQLGMYATDETKGKVACNSTRPLSEISFLKRHFLWDDRNSAYLAPLDLSVVLEMVNWVRGDEDQIDACIENVETAFKELSLHPEPIFSKYSHLLFNACLDYMNTAPTLLPRQAYTDNLYHT
jgi:hypothetical protein